MSLETLLAEYSGNVAEEMHEIVESQKLHRGGKRKIALRFCTCSQSLILSCIRHGLTSLETLVTEYSGNVAEEMHEIVESQNLHRGGKRKI